MNLPQVSAVKIGAGGDINKAISLSIPLGGIIASILIGVLIIWPKINEIIELKKSNEQLEIRAQKIEAKAALLVSFDKDELEDQLVAAEQILPSDKKIFEVLRQIEEAASLSGVLLNKIDVDVGSLNDNQLPVTPTNATKSGSLSGNVPSVGIKLSATSDYASLLRFLATVYSFSRIATIETISLNPSVNEGLEIRSAFTLDAYWKSLPGTLGSIESPVEELTDSEKELLAKVKTPEVLEAPTLPQVPTGRKDLFTPYGKEIQPVTLE